jgi:hypothetical protein
MRSRLSEWIQQAINLDSKGDGVRRNERRVKRVAARHGWKNSSSILCIVRQFRLVLMKAGTPLTAQVRLNADGTRSA